jgi:IS5 family transposase
MDASTLLAVFCSRIKPRYPKAGHGRPPEEGGRILRIYCVANWFKLSDEACEDALNDVATFRECGRLMLDANGRPI